MGFVAGSPRRSVQGSNFDFLKTLQLWNGQVLSRGKVFASQALQGKGTRLADQLVLRWLHRMRRVFINVHP